MSVRSIQRSLINTWCCVQHQVFIGLLPENFSNRSFAFSAPVLSVLVPRSLRSGRRHASALMSPAKYELDADRCSGSAYHLAGIKKRRGQVQRRLRWVKKMEMNGTELHLSEYGFERRFDERGAIRWMQENWWGSPSLRASWRMYFTLKRCCDAAGSGIPSENQILPCYTLPAGFTRTRGFERL